MADLTVKYFNSGMTGAPQISNNWGDLVTMLDACLVNGFALKAIDSLTFADGVATASITAGHAYLRDQVVLIAGADQPEYNGLFRVISTTTTTFTYAVTGTPVTPATTATSISAKVAQPGRMVYSASKAAILNVTKTQAAFLAPQNIRVNSVSPGWTWSNIIRDITGDKRAKADNVAAPFHLLKRTGGPEEVANTVMFLCSAEASFITGTDIAVDGGYTAIGAEQQTDALPLLAQ